MNRPSRLPRPARFLAALALKMGINVAKVAIVANPPAAAAPIANSRLLSVQALAWQVDL